MSGDPLLTLKRKYGQFFTTNCDVILAGFPKPLGPVIEPFVGNGDLVRWLGRDTEEYDISPKRETTIERDTLLNPPSYKDKFVLTNPPYLARNKNKDKTLYDKFQQNDLFKIFLKQICDDCPIGGNCYYPS